ncbi:MAG: hypothetical protein ABL986_17895 [Vicinamibacterales bacterium]
MITTLAAACLGGCVLSLVASVLMSKASNLSPAWNIAIGGLVAMSIALVLLVLVLIIERVAFA